ncbi:hypothetical protein BSG1_08351 [Bacillus sp. SG-1]|nr:hypothetical protein BSG1_08351 [Bacillus sp. SG-1]
MNHIYKNLLINNKTLFSYILLLSEKSKKPDFSLGDMGFFL